MNDNGPVPNKSEQERRSVLFYVFLAAVVLVFIQTFRLLSPIILSLLLILLISLAVNPVIIMIRSWTGGRKGATAVLALLVIAVIGLTGWVFSVPMKNSVTDLAQILPEYWERLQKPLIKLEQHAVTSENKLQAEVIKEIADKELEVKPHSGEIEDESAVSETAQPNLPPEPDPEPEPKPEPKSTTESGSFRSGISQMFQGVAGRFTAIAINVAQMMVVLITVFFGVTYTLMNPRPIFGAMFALVPERHHGKALRIMQRIGNFVPRWAGATLLGMVVMGVLTFFAMWPFFGFKDALVLGLITGLLEAVPFIGPVLSAVPALLLAFGKGGLTPLWVLLAYLAIQAVESNVITPMVMAQGLKLHPLAVILSMLLCVAAFGVLGVLVAAPLVAIVSILYEELYRKRFLPTVTNEELERLSRKALHEQFSMDE